MTKVPSPFGPQYSEDDDFKRRARLHQSRFRAEHLGASEFREYGNRLCTAEALQGKNFFSWPGMLDSVSRRYPLADNKLYFDMLRSEHIPFNLFVPLSRHAALLPLVRLWTGLDVAEITALEIEWAPAPKIQFLDDATSFDTYIAYRVADDSHGAIGIEVKYTEHEYPWGKTERQRMFDSTSAYHRVHEAANLYVDGCMPQLRTERLKQVWRNQLLGEAMLQRATPALAHFTSVLMYPTGNTHFAEVVREHKQLLRFDGRRNAFRSSTYEEFIAHCGKYATSQLDQAWVEYLSKRYIVA